MKPDQAHTELANAIRKHGAPVCQTTDPEIWFPDVGNAYGDTRKAKKLCSECPVRVQCLEFAIVNVEIYGIWGGTTNKERQKLRVARGRKAGRPVTKVK